ncbi:MAG: VWA domain-containing protein [Acidobacteriota bacterium]
MRLSTFVVIFSVIPRAVLLLVVGLALFGVAAAHGQDADSRTFRGSADVVYVEVPVNVVHDGKAVRGLTAENFQVIDKRKKREIVGFEVIDLEAITIDAAVEDAPQELVTMPSAARRHFLLLFDLSFSNPESVVRAREAARELVSNDLHAQDLAAVATYSFAKGPEIVLGFTSDRRQLDKAIETLGVPQLIDRRSDPLGLVLADMQGEGGASGGSALTSGGGGFAGEAVAEFIRTSVQRIQQFETADAQNQIVSMSEGMANLAQMLDTVRGRKHVVYLSQGFDSTVFLGRGPSQQRSDAVAANVAEAMAANFEGSTSDTSFGNTQVQNALARMAEAFQRTNATIQAVDIAGIRNKGGGVVAGANLQDEGLFYMANETGGQLYRNANDLGEAMGELLNGTSVTYLLAFRADDVSFDGAYRKLKIKLRGDDVPRGARAYHRAGYFTPKPYAERNRGERQLDAASQIFGREGGALDVEVLSVPVATETDRAYVPVVIEIGGASLLDGGAGDGKLPVEIYGYAIADDGTVVDNFAQAFQIDASQNSVALRARGVKVYAHVDLVPGDYTLRVLVRHGADGRSTLRVNAVDVPDFTVEAARLLPPMVAESPAQWLLVREPTERRGEGDPFPFLHGQNPYMPAAAPSLPARGAIDIAALAYGVGDPVRATGRLLDAAGQPIDGVAFDLLGARAAPDSPGQVQLDLRLDVDGVAPGDYVIEVELQSGTTDQPLTARAPVQIAAANP